MSVSNRKEILKQISDENGIQLKNISALTGGDINEVFLLESNSEKFVVKLNDHRRFPGMFEAEKLGLEKLSAPSVIDVPKPIKTGQLDSQSYLLLDYKDSAAKKDNFWEVFGEQMAELHQQTRESFGLEKDNYIGSLPQYNDPKDSAAEFYIEMRLQPQIQMAEEKGFDLNVSEKFYKNCEEIIPSEKPALVHGDLWNGNYLVNSLWFALFNRSCGCLCSQGNGSGHDEVIWRL